MSGPLSKISASIGLGGAGLGIIRVNQLELGWVRTGQQHVCIKKKGGGDGGGEEGC